MNDNRQYWTINTLVDWKHYEHHWVKAKIIAIEQRRIKVCVNDESCTCESEFMRTDDENIEELKVIRRHGCL